MIADNLLREVALFGDGQAWASRCLIENYLSSLGLRQPTRQAATA